MRFLLITATDLTARSLTHLSALTDSIGDQAVVCDLVLVMRRPGRPPSWTPGNVTVHPVAVPRATSLSSARNVALAHARAHGLLARCDIVAFPDDDCAYTRGVLDVVATLVAAGAGMVCGVHGPSADAVDWARFPPERQPVTVDLIMRALGSGTMFLSADVVRAVGDFDEALRLGARYGSSEDADYMIRALAARAPSVYAPQQILVLHPYKPHRHDEYFAGNVAALAKHALRQHRTLSPLLRRLVVGLLLVLRRRLSGRSYLAALRAATLMIIPIGGERAQGYT